MDQFPNLVNVIIVSAGVIQCFVIIALLFAKKSSNRNASFFLSFLLIVLTFQMIIKVASKVWVMHTFGFYYWLSYDTPFLFGPLLYGYVKNSVSPEARFRFRDLLHLVPFAYIWFFQALYRTNLLDIIPNFFLPEIIYNVYVHLLLQTGTLMLYTYLSLRLIRQKENLRNTKSAVTHKINLTWLRTFSIAFSVTGICLIITLRILFAVYPEYTNWRFLFAGLTVFIYWIGYRALSNPGILNFVIPAGTPVGTNGNGYEHKYMNSGLAVEQQQKILEALRLTIKTQKPFTNPDLNIEQLAEMLSVSRHHLSQVINDKLHKNFNTFINECRVEEAKGLLKSPAVDRITIAAIAYESGFNTISNFNTIFKKITGMTPSQFRRSGNQIEVLTRENIVGQDAIVSDG